MYEVEADLFLDGRIPTDYNKQHSL